MLGVIFPGNDKSGRSFPFIMFCNIRKTIIDNLAFYLIPSAFENIFLSFNEIINSGIKTDDISILKSLTDNIKLSSIDTYSINDNFKKNISGSTLLNVFNTGNEGLIQLNDFFNNNIKVMDHFICFNSPSKVDQTGEAFLISYCVQLLQKIFRNNSNPVIFWTSQVDKPLRLLLSFIKPTPKDFNDLLVYSGGSMENENSSDSTSHLFRDNSSVKDNISLNEFLNSVGNFLN